MSESRPAVRTAAIRVLFVVAAVAVGASRHAAVAGSPLADSIELQLGLWFVGIAGYLFAIQSTVGSIVVGVGLGAAIVWFAPVPATMGPEGFAYVAAAFVVVVPTVVVATLGLLVQHWERR